MSVMLRPMRLEDGAQVLAWRNTPAVAASMYTDHAITPAEHDGWLQAALHRDDRRYWIVVVDGAPAGVANLAGIDRRNRRCELGHYLADPSARGRGIGAAVEYIVLQQVFETFQLNKLWCEVLAGNEAAWRLHEGFGFTREAHLRAHIWKEGRFWDVIGLGILASDWAAARPACQARLIAKGHDLSTLIVAD